MKRIDYTAPCVLRQVSICAETGLMAGSIVDKASVTSVGQEVDTYDFSTESFNHEWED